MRKFVVNIVMMLLVCIGYAQELPNIVPPTPNAHSLGQYGEVPIGMFTGSPNMAIPITAISLQGYSLPVNLVYNSNGIRIDQYSSPVGLGWDLIANGVITRRVNDEPDEEVNQVIMPDPETKLYTPEMLNFLQINTATSGEDGYDHQPDVFTFNFNGYSGSFFLKQDANGIISNRTVVLMEASPLLIDIQLIDYELTFVITDPTGIVYTFGGDSNAIERSKSSSSCGETPYKNSPHFVANAWYLKEIKLPSSRTIDFEYQKKTVYYDTGVTQSISRDSNQSRVSCSRNPHDTPCKLRTTAAMCYLKAIRSDIQDVEFSYSQKAGMPNGMDKLDKITIRNQNNAVIKKHLLAYKSYTTSVAPSPYYHTENSDGIRFYLDRITEQNADNVSKKPHVFEYYEPHKLPARFSFSQDYWGFYNGKNNLSLIDDETLTLVASQLDYRNRFTNFNPADKTSRFYSYGLLNKIIYPTKGYSTLHFEPNTYSIFEKQYPDQIHETKWAQTSNNGVTASNKVVISDVAFDQWADLSFLRELIEEGFGNPTLTLDTFQFLFKIKDITTNKYDVCMWRYVPNIEPACKGTATSSGITIYLEDTGLPYKVRLLKNHSYEFTLSVTRANTKAGFNISYYNEEPITVEVNKEAGGGRIGKVENFDYTHTLLQAKKYHYNTLEKQNLSSGALLKSWKSSVLVNECYRTSQLGNNEFGRYTTILSNSAFPTYSGPHMGYHTVIEELGENYTEGGTIHKFSVARRTELGNISIHGMYIPGTPLTNHFGLGDKLEEHVFTKRGNHFLTLSTKQWMYEYDDRLDDEFIGYHIRRRGSLRDASAFLEDPAKRIHLFDITSFSMIKRWKYLDSEISRVFDINGENPITTTTKYKYANPLHQQPTQVETTNSKEETLITNTWYAHELNNTALLNENRVTEPIKTETLKKVGSTTTTLSGQNTVYTGVLPSIIQTKKNSQGYEDRIVYHKYDNRRNPIEVSKADGTHIVYIWGYDQTQPVAKIEGAKVSDIPDTYINPIQAASNIDNDRTQGYVGKEGNLRKQLNKLHQLTALKNAQITFFTYDPLIGVTSITDPRGEVVYYEYDEFNRLKFVKNAEGQILKENVYHYKNQ
ncbi:RHS repeat protein [Tenacibaculum agarivorans]|uniref:RHS repeat protein n=1 Tax=Tenacibaculum agarivorans TaxID=1908389 RepID=UPI000AB2986F|nr:RHS repeat domain-containing protein [Tenacibaculum agarivorans]